MAKESATWTPNRIRHELLFTLNEQHMKDHRIPIEFSERILTKDDPPWRDLVRELAYLEDQGEVSFVSDIMSDRVICRLTAPGRDALGWRKYQECENILCPHCQGPLAFLEGAEARQAQCRFCAATVDLGNRKYSVEGKSADEVEAVLSRIIANQSLTDPPSPTKQNPWISGSFYLSAVVVISLVLLVLAKLLPAFALAPLIVGIVMLLSVVGVLQLRHDSSLSEEGFISLLVRFWRQIPSFLNRKRD